jgi:hypothetical protein
LLLKIKDSNLLACDTLSLGESLTMSCRIAVCYVGTHCNPAEHTFSCMVILLGLLAPESGGTAIIQNAGNYSPIHGALHHRSLVPSGKHLLT